MHTPEYSSREWRLQEWQSALQACIVDPQQDRERLRPRLQAGSVDVDSQLEIYANAYVLRLVEALRDNYPALHHALGDADFDVMARRYLERYPSTRASIRWFGDSMALFLQERDPWRQVPVLSELAAFEWAVRHTIDAADADRLTTETLLSVPLQDWGELRFDLHPSVTLLSLQWNAPQLWRELTDAATDPSGGAIEPARQPLHWLVYREPDLASGWRSLTDMEQVVLERLQQGATFADLCACIALHDPGDAATRAAGLLRLWIEQGILIARHSPFHESMTD
jgi:hypothetical protein